MPTGQVIGSSTANGAFPQTRRLDPNDLLATIYRFLGIDYNAALPHPSGRAMPILPQGEPIAELS